MVVPIDQNKTIITRDRAMICLRVTHERGSQEKIWSKWAPGQRCSGEASLASWRRRQEALVSQGAGEAYRGLTVHGMKSQSYSN